MTDTDTVRSGIYTGSENPEDATQYVKTTTKLNTLITTENLSKRLASEKMIKAIIGAVFGEKITHLTAGKEEYNLGRKLSTIQVKTGDYRTNHFKALNLINEISDLLVTANIFAEKFDVAAMFSSSNSELENKLNAIGKLNTILNKEMFTECFNAAFTKHGAGIAKVKKLKVQRNSGSSTGETFVTAMNPPVVTDSFDNGLSGHSVTLTNADSLLSASNGKVGAAPGDGSNLSISMVALSSPEASLLYHFTQ